MKLKVKNIMQIRGVKQVEALRALRCPPSILSLYLNGWKTLPTKYRKPLAEFLGLTEQEIIENSVEQDDTNGR